MKNKWVAGLLSFIFPGVGHLYLGQIGKGVMLMVANVISMLLISVIVGVFLFLGVWLYAIVTSIKEANAINSIAQVN